MARPHRKLPIFTKEEQNRFWSKINIGAPDQCWPFIDANHYGEIRLKKRRFLAHRIGYFLYYGDDPGNQLICHRCDNPPCCNPHHLFKGTHADNSTDMKRKSRAASGERHGLHLHPERAARGDKNGARLHPERMTRGERHWKARFTEEQIKKMQAMRGSNFSYNQIAEVFQSDAKTVWRLINGKGRAT